MTSVKGGSVRGSEHSTGPVRRPGAGRASRVRPYAITGGRTRFGHVLLVETLVSALNRPATAEGGGLPELDAICELCRGHMRSIAEIAALLRIPLGVVRVLVSDLADQGRIRVHGAPGGDGYGDVQDTGDGTAAGSTANRALLERVLGGLRKL
ncbi:DUF742 domain-containing protein [Streptacidiphilus griseoplanus]|uniref:DUF742 domain-containing protein n=1 Tax=Peterkaempfera griseoplana TaxID=66896 RepID=UPI0006E38E1C|nr:DUF742 domain-containing protein [Peterkaempfera griseoplana]